MMERIQNNIRCPFLATSRCGRLRFCGGAQTVILHIPQQTVHVMGLSFHHLDLHTSYGGFAYFRRMLADSMGWKYYGDTFLEWHKHSEGEKFRDDPMFVFMMHSDCDGSISPEDCLK